MATVQRGNVVLQVPDEPDVIQKYKDKGFDIIDGVTGKIIDRAMPQEPGALRARVLELEAENAKLRDDVVKLQKEAVLLNDEVISLRTAKKTASTKKTSKE